MHTCVQKCNRIRFLHLQSTILHLKERGEGEREMPGSPATLGVIKRPGKRPAVGWLRYRNSEIMQYKGSHSCYFQAWLSRVEGAKEWT